MTKETAATGHRQPAYPAPKPEYAAPPVKPAAFKYPAPPAGEDRYKLDPTRFGDWEINGRCIDF